MKIFTLGELFYNLYKFCLKRIWHNGFLSETVTVSAVWLLLQSSHMLHESFVTGVISVVINKILLVNKITLLIIKA